MRAGVVFLLIAAAVPGARAQGDAAIEVRASTSTIGLGDPLILSAAARFPLGAALSLDLERSATDYFSIGRVEQEPVQESGGWRTQGFRVEILPLAVGRLSIPLAWSLTTPKASQAVASAPVIVEVREPALEGQGQLKDIKTPIAARPALWPWLLGALLAALAWLAYTRLRRQGAFGPAAVLPVDNRPAHVIAEEELSKLEAQGLWSQGRFKEFYIELTDIMRRFLERRFRMPATRLTTAELHRQLRHAEIDRPLTSLFKDLFDRADLVKFARILPDSDWGPKDLEAARRFVEANAVQDLVSLGKEGAP